MVILDSNHTHEHVFSELHAYKDFITTGSYIIVSDTVIEEIPQQTHRPRNWGQGNNPRTAVDAFLAAAEGFSFSRDNEYNKKAINSFTRNGYLKRL